MAESMSLEELNALPLVVDLETAGRAYGIGRTKAYQMARGVPGAGDLPFRVRRVGDRYKVTKPDLFDGLGLPYPPRQNVA